MSTSAKPTRFEQGTSAKLLLIASSTSLRLCVVSHTKERIYYHLREMKKGEERKRKEEKEKGGERRRKECPIEAILNNQSVKLF